MKRWVRVLLTVALAASMAVEALAAAQPHDHELTYVVAKDACIARQGNAEHYYCAACDKYFSDAEEYNEKLKKLPIPLLEHENVEGYWDILNLSGTGMMGYVSIEKINVELPLYHGTDDDVLSVAVGHIQGTSFPVGGLGTHSVVSAHRGLPSSTLFTHLDKLEIGDTFTITILDRVFTYQVDKIQTVSPSDTSALAIEDNADYCTLLTCTPYGINTHRLLVRGVRIETVEHKTIYVTSDAYQIDSLIVTPVVALPILFTLMMIVLFKPVEKSKNGEDLE
jgi:sortase A